MCILGEGKHSFNKYLLGTLLYADIVPGTLNIEQRKKGRKKVSVLVEFTHISGNDSQVSASGARVDDGAVTEMGTQGEELVWSWWGC